MRGYLERDSESKNLRKGSESESTVFSRDSNHVVPGRVEGSKFTKSVLDRLQDPVAGELGIT